ncbi:MAG: type IV secretion system protein TraC [Chlamydiales bacterium]
MMNLLSGLGSQCLKMISEPFITYDKQSNLKDMYLSDTIAQQLSYESYDEEKEIFLNTNSAGFIIEATPLVGGDETVSKMLDALFEDFMQEGASIQCLLWADHRVEPFLKGWSKSTVSNEIYSEITKQRSKHYLEHPRISPRMFRFILSYSIPYTENEGIHDLVNVKEKLLKMIKSMTSASLWKPKDLLQSVGGILNFSLKSELIKRSYNPLQTISGQLLTGGKLQVDKESLSWENNTKASFKSFRVIDTPSYWSHHSMQNLIGDVVREGFRINYPFFIHYGVHYPHQEKAESSFRMRSQLIENQGKSGNLIRMIPELSNELKECDSIRRAIKTGSKFVWTQLSCGVWAEKERLHDAEQTLTNIFTNNQFNLVQNYYLHLPHLLSILPLSWSEYAQDLKDLDVLKTTISKECAHFVPLHGEWAGTSTPGMLLHGRRGQIMNWNPFDNKSGNYNCVVLGKSGAGKSVFMQDLIMNGLRGGARIYIIDVGRSYEKLCEIVQGQQLEFSKNTNICLNPFSKLNITDQEELETALSFLKPTIACMAAPQSGTNELENSYIEKAILRVWDEKGNQATITDISEQLISFPDEKAKNLGIMLTPYTKKGMYAKYFEGENNVDLSNPFILVELEELKGKRDLQAVILQLMIMTITNQAFLGDRKTPFYICIDEAWDLLRAKQSGDFIETLARRLRKYNGSLVVGSQNVEDFFSTPGAVAAFDNSDWVCFLAQKKPAISVLEQSKRFGENKNIFRALESVSTRAEEYSEVMIYHGDGSYNIARVVLDRFSYLLYSTKADDYARLKDLTRSGLSTVQAIHKIMEEEGRR